MVAIPENGDLEQRSLPCLLMDLRHAKFSGRLALSHDRCEKAFLFSGGYPVYAESNLASESLGVQLMDRGSITRPDYAKVVSIVEKKQCKEGSALLELGFIEPRELFVALREQIRLRLLECFGWPRGTFSIDPNEKPPDDAHPFRADLYSLVQEGIENHWSSDRLLTSFEAKMTRYPIRTQRFASVQQSLHSDDAVVELISRLDGSTTFWKALQAAVTPRSMAAAWVLDTAGALEFCDKLVEPTTATPEFEVELVFEDAAVQPAKPEAKESKNDAEFIFWDFEQEITEKFSRLSEANHYELLGVDASAEAAEIRSAYLKAAKTYHPDALARAELDDSVREKAGKVFAAIGKAHAVLAKSDRRSKYDTALGSDLNDGDAERLANAETLFRKGDILLRQGNFKMALQFLAPAVEAWPEEADYQSALGWALYKMMPSDTEAAKEHLDAAMKLRPDDAVVVFRLSVIMRALGDTVAAETLGERARELDPAVSG